MKRLVIAAMMIIAAVWSVSTLANGIGVVDMTKVMKSSSQVKALRAKFDKQFAAKRAKLTKESQKLRGEVKKLERNKLTMSKSAISKAQKELMTQGAAFRQEQTQFQQEVFKAQSKAMNSFMDKVQKAAAAVAKENNLDIVVAKNTVIFSIPKMDVTQKLLKDLK